MPRSSVTSLSLEGCNITPSALEKVIQALPQTKISQLYIDNPLDNDKLQYISKLSRILPTTRLVTFYLKNVTKTSHDKDLQKVQKIAESLPIKNESKSIDIIWSAHKDLLWQWNLKLPVSLYDFLRNYNQHLFTQQFRNEANNNINELINELDVFIKTINIDYKELSPDKAFKFKFRLFLDKLFTNSDLFNKLAYLIFNPDYDVYLSADNKKTITQAREVFQENIDNTKNMLTKLLAKTKIIVKQVAESPYLLQSKYKDGDKITHPGVMLIPDYYPTLYALLNHAYDDYLSQEDLDWIEQNKPTLFKLIPPSSDEKFFQLLFRSKDKFEEYKKDNPHIGYLPKEAWTIIVEECMDKNVTKPSSVSTNSRKNTGPSKT
jgi:hypothetical protein